MNLPTEAWYTRWFLWSTAVVYEWTARRAPWYYKQHGTNLCQFIRVTWLWAPLIVACHLAVVGIWVAALVGYPIYVFGFSSWGGWVLQVGGFLIGFLLLLGLGGLLVYFRTIINQKSQVVEAKATRVKRDVVERVKRVEAPSYASILFQWILAKKRKICPVITFEVKEREHVASI